MSKICVMCDEGVTPCDNCGICAANKRNIDNWLEELTDDQREQGDVDES